MPDKTGCTINVIYALDLCLIYSLFKTETYTILFYNKKVMLYIWSITLNKFSILRSSKKMRTDPEDLSLSLSLSLSAIFLEGEWLLEVFLFWHIYNVVVSYYCKMALFSWQHEFLLPFLTTWCLYSHLQNGYMTTWLVMWPRFQKGTTLSYFQSLLFSHQ